MSFLSYIIIVFLIKQCLCEETVEISLKQGKLIGKIEKTIYNKQDYFIFRGVPFAEPPISELRFQPPKPHEGWDGTLEAYDNKPTCMQLNTRGRLREPPGISGSEDCLYINIFTPDIKETAPVLVFDFNDNFRTWFNGTETYSPDFLIEEGIVVVTIGNRLGVFGYLTTEDHVIPGNNGLRDFILGLEWLKDNIEQFGGDPSRITLMGSRGGATIAELLLYSEKAKNLFSGAILQSGTSFETMLFYEDSRASAFHLGELLNITATNSEELYQELISVDAEKILNADFDILIGLNNDNQMMRLPFTPTVEYGTENRVIIALPENGKIINDVPVIVGFNSREGLDLVSQYIFEPRLLKTDADEHLVQMPIRTGFVFEIDSAKYKEANKAILEFYYEDKSLHYNNILEHAVFVGDYSQNYALNVAAEKLSRSLSSSVFYYVFDYRGLLNENTEILVTKARFSVGNTGATILDELCYIFVCSRIQKTYKELISLPSEQPEIKVMKRITRLWANFARTGNPTPTEDDPILKNFVWEPFSNESDSKYLHISKVLRMKSNPLGDRKKFWDDFIERYSKEAVDGVVRGEEARDEL